MLQAFIERIPTHIPALLKLVEVCVDGGLETAMYDTQARLTDAYLATSQPAEARVIAEDLVAREPWEARTHRALQAGARDAAGAEPDMVIAQRLNGETPFTATDYFAGPARG